MNENLLADPEVRETVREVADMGFSEQMVLAAIKLGYTTVDEAFEYLLAHPEMKLNEDREKEERTKLQQSLALSSQDGEGEEVDDWLFVQKRSDVLDEPPWPLPRQSETPYYALSSDALGYLYLRAQAALPPLWRIAVEVSAAAWCLEERVVNVPASEDKMGGAFNDDDETSQSGTEEIFMRVTRLPIRSLWQDNPHVLQAVEVGLKGVHRAVKKAWRHFDGDVHRITDLVS